MQTRVVFEKIKVRCGAIHAEGDLALYVYDSRARGKCRQDSDLGVFVEYDPASRFSLLNLAGVKLILDDALGLKVHVTTRDRRGNPPRRSV
jgi:uncharacterized protein